MKNLATTTPARHAVRAALLAALGGALLLTALATPANATPAAMVSICHATGSESNPFVNVTANAAGIYNGHIAHQHSEDVIPLFTYNDVQYSQNLDAEGLALLANDCNPPGGNTTSTTSSTTSTTTGEVPFFTSGTTLLLGVGGALGGTLLMLRRRI